MSLYKLMICLHLENCVKFWYPHLEKLSQHWKVTEKGKKDYYCYGITSVHN